MKRFQILLLTLALLFLTFILIPSKKVNAHFGYLPPNQTALDIIAEVNVLRSANNVAPYQVNSVLMGVAQSHADYLASTGVVTHFGADGSRPFQRAISAGYSVAGDLSLGGFFSENIVSGAGLSASEVVAIWQGDSAHLTTMISSDLKDIGVGIAVANGLTYYVLDAGASTGELINSPTFVVPLVITSTPGTQIAPVLVSTPLENGEVYHEVQLKEALWSIAVAYNTTVEQIKLLNGLATDEIFAGQKLLVKRPDPPTATPTVVLTATFGIPTSTATIPVTFTTTATPTPLPTPPASLKVSSLAVGLIILIALVAAGIGSWLGRKSTK